MQLKTGRKAWKISKRRFSQTVRKQFATIANFAMCSQTSFALRNPICPVHCTLAKFASYKTYAKFRIAKIRNEFASQIRNAKISQYQIRNAKISQSQFRNAKANFAMPKPISQCQNQFRNAKILFMCHNLCEISHCEIHNPLCEFRKPISHCQIHCLLRNSHLQALSSSVINATDFQTW